jgi:hypothetical protein
MKIIESNPSKLVVSELGSLSGVYFLRLAGKIVYIGKSINVLDRVFGDHYKAKGFDQVKIHWMPKDQITRYEREQIAIHRPPLNDLTQSKRHRPWERLNRRFQ